MKDLCWGVAELLTSHTVDHDLAVEMRVTGEEWAKAGREVAKATEKAIEAGEKLGQFFATVFGPGLKEVGGVFHDHVRYFRASRLLRLQKQFDALCVENGVEPTRPVSLKIGLPLLEAASLEDDDTLQDLFARLLVNATDRNSSVEVQKVFVSILSELSRLDASILWKLCSEAPKGEGNTYETAGLPAEIWQSPIGENPPLPPEDIQLSLWNLARLGCVEPAGTWGGGTTVAVVSVTALGRTLINACAVGKS